ncbi:RNA polymerase sigma-70 factor (ECF subfamily) [Haloactinospora alba]|uniref:RNA polymerase sigma-70 factor (ECF subfamily) n=1 Tax=Haloactinospora alba TaxID=405555 RepID=A0A543N9L3_9ACTN|nr:RNA polymerase sigma factor [Haloactinospora alba]TQN28490.1 RNA polymerase sigma-70 factor (ECF subfamily) [Haloactinospora alba]
MSAEPYPDVQHTTDADIIARSREAPEAFAELFDRYADDIHRYTARRLGSEAADDLVADTFVLAFRRRGSYESAREHARPWLYGIATNLIRQRRRAEARRWRAIQRTASAGADTGELDERVTERVSAASVRGRLAGALAALPARHRDVLLAVAWGGMDYAEVAEALGIPVGTVRSRLHRARVKVRAELGETDPTAVNEEDHHG